MLYLKTRHSILTFLLLPILSAAQYSNNDLPYTVNNGIISCEKGVPQAPRWFADSRLAFCFDETGIAQVDYYNPVPGQSLPTLFLRQLWDGFRYFLEMDNKTYKPTYLNSRIWPFGIESEWNFGGVTLKHRVMAIDESIVIQVIVPDNIPANLRFKMEFFEAFALTKGSDDDIRFTGSNTRQWDKWKFSTASNILEGGFTSFPEAQRDKPVKKPFQTRYVIGADFPVEHSVRPINPKHMLKSPPLKAGKTYSFCISFGQDQSLLSLKNRQLANTLSQAIQQQFERYRKVGIAMDKKNLFSNYFTNHFTLLF